MLEVLCGASKVAASFARTTCAELVKSTLAPGGCPVEFLTFLRKNLEFEPDNSHLRQALDNPPVAHVLMETTTAWKDDVSIMDVCLGNYLPVARGVTKKLIQMFSESLVAGIDWGDLPIAYANHYSVTKFDRKVLKWLVVKAREAGAKVDLTFAHQLVTGKDADLFRFLHKLGVVDDKKVSADDGRTLLH